MTPEVERLYQAALKLSSDERYYLATQLLESVEAERDPDYEEAWADEITRRIEEVDNGTAKMVSWEEVQRMMNDVRHRGAES
jgi:putative addiction module component (TIGR02574 family)